MVAICHSGKNPTMRHLRRTHGISLTMLHDEVTGGNTYLSYISTAQMKADIFIKALNGPRYRTARDMIGLV